MVYHHRGAYLNAINNVVAWELPKHAVYLWTLPMFHCNGWCFPWTLAAVAGTNVCLRRVDVNAIYDLIAQEKVTHYCGAPDGALHADQRAGRSAGKETTQGLRHDRRGAARPQPSWSRWSATASTSPTSTG